MTPAIKQLNQDIGKLCRSFKELSACKTKKDKLLVLARLGQDEEFSRTIEYLLNDNKISGIRKSKLNKKISEKSAKNLIIVNYYNLNTMLDYLVGHNTGSDQEILIVRVFLDKIVNDEDRQIVADIITKDYKCGVTDLTAYGLIPGLERNWRERKGHSLINNKTGEIDLSKILGKKVMVTLKLDGYRFKIYKADNTVTFYSSSGKIVEGLVELEEYAIENIADGLYDGECIAIGDFRDSTERFNATTKILRKDGEKRGVEFIAFDYMNLSDAEKFFDYEKVKKLRYDRFLDLLDKGLSKKGLIKPVTCYMSNVVVTEEVIAKIINIYEMVVEKGEEGLVIDIADAPYERKKGNSMFKLKPELTGDFKVVDAVEGKGKDKGRLGAFIIEYKGNTVNVGSGLSDAIRNEVWQDKETYIDKLIEVTYFGETQDESGLYSLRLPRFKRFRHDKNDISYD